ncbi:hypothetical protein [Patulibacter americanus]|uniref:hypothetical protein n=1 Tax=Patulibacter americanus TaxID=588672 RepID=UPI0003B50CC1|nr:hypothetical protein [Patulibacter americanus]
MSFFDDDDFDEPTHVADAEPRRGAGARAAGRFGGFGAGRPSGPGGGGGGAGGSVDPKTARQRQIVASGIIVLVLILLVVGVQSCVNGSRTSALKDYARDVTAVLQESRDDVSEPLFRALASGEDANTLQTSLNRLRETAESQAERVKNFSEPGDDSGKAAQHDLELAMNFRARAVRIIAEQIPAAKADEDTSEAAARRIAGELGAFLASDVIVSQRTKPLIDEALAAKDVSGANVSAPATLRDVSLLDPVAVLSTLAGGGGGSTGEAASSGAVRDRSGEEPAQPGTHGTALNAVSFGDTALQAGGEATTVTGRAVTVSVQNGGDTDETNIDVGVTFTPSGGGRAVSTKKTVASIAQGQTAEVELELPATVRSGQSGELVVKVGGVPGEEKLDNNEATYSVTIGG